MTEPSDFFDHLRLVFIVEFVFDIADDGFDNIVQSNKPVDTAMLIHNHGHMFLSSRIIRNSSMTGMPGDTIKASRAISHGTDGFFIEQAIQNILNVEHAHDFIEVLLEHRNAAELLFSFMITRRSSMEASCSMAMMSARKVITS